MYGGQAGKFKKKSRGLEWLEKRRLRQGRGMGAFAENKKKAAVQWGNAGSTVQGGVEEKPGGGAGP